MSLKRIRLSIITRRSFGYNLNYMSLKHKVIIEDPTPGFGYNLNYMSLKHYR